MIRAVIRFFVIIKCSYTVQKYTFSLNFASVVIDRVVCHRPINTQIALLIAKALDIAADLLLWLQARDKIIMSKRNHSYMERMDKIRKIAAVLC